MIKRIVMLLLLLASFALAHIDSEPTFEDSGIVFWTTSGIITFFYAYGRLSAIFKRKRGTIISFESSLAEKCSTSNLPVRVKLDSGEELVAEMAGCTLCYHRFKIGSRVALDLGPNGRLIIQQPAKMTIKEKFDISMESCSVGCIRDRESKKS